MGDQPGRRPLWKRAGDIAQVWGYVVGAIAATPAAVAVLWPRVKAAPPWAGVVAGTSLFLFLAGALLQAQMRWRRAERDLRKLTEAQAPERWPPGSALLAIVDPTTAAALIVVNERGKELADAQCALVLYNRAPFPVTVHAARFTWVFLGGGRPLAEFKTKVEDKHVKIEPAGSFRIHLKESEPFAGDLPQPVCVKVHGHVEVSGPWTERLQLPIGLGMSLDERTVAWIAADDQRPSNEDSPGS